jgi:hypothetical protein
MPRDLAGLDSDGNQLACDFGTPHAVPGLQDGCNGHIATSELTVAPSWPAIVFRCIGGIRVCIFDSRKEIRGEDRSHSAFEVGIRLHHVQEVDRKWDKRKVMIEYACL